MDVGLGFNAGFSAGISAGVSASAGAGFNASLTLGTGPGSRTDPHLAVNFLVEIEGLVVGGFQEVTGLQVETETEDYREGGVNEYVHKLAGPTRYPSNLVLKRGITDADALWGWHQQVVQGSISRKNGSIYLLDRQGNPSMWWNFTGAYPVKWSGPELRAEQNAVAAESVELVHRGIGRPMMGVQASVSVSLDLSAGFSAGLSAGFSADVSAGLSGGFGF